MNPHGRGKKIHRNWHGKWILREELDEDDEKVKVECI